jgi:hypothetical protein
MCSFCTVLFTANPPLLDELIVTALQFARCCQVSAPEGSAIAKPITSPLQWLGRHHRSFSASAAHRLPSLFQVGFCQCRAIASRRAQPTLGAAGSELRRAHTNERAATARRAEYRSGQTTRRPALHGPRRKSLAEASRAMRRDSLPSPSKRFDVAACWIAKPAALHCRSPNIDRSRSGSSVSVRCRLRHLPATAETRCPPISLFVPLPPYCGQGAHLGSPVQSIHRPCCAPGSARLGK